MKRFTYSVVVLMLAAQCLPAGEASSSTDKSHAQPLATLQLTDIRGEVHQPFENSSTKAIALIFVSTDCPIANSFQPTLQELRQRYEPQGVACFMVYSSGGVALDQIEKHVEDFKIKMPVIADAEQRIARLTQARVTPEAIVIDPHGRIRYRGQISNLYVGYGKKRPAATEHYLQVALDALVEGGPIAITETKPLGCFIHYDAVQPASTK